jgi:hypothetical protein
MQKGQKLSQKGYDRNKSCHSTEWRKNFIFKGRAWKIWFLDRYIDTTCLYQVLDYKKIFLNNFVVKKTFLLKSIFERYLQVLEWVYKWIFTSSWMGLQMDSDYYNSDQDLIQTKLVSQWNLLKHSPQSYGTIPWQFWIYF